MRRSHFLTGENGDGSMRMTRAGGFSGIAGITWGDGVWMMSGRLGGGLRSNVILRNFKMIVRGGISRVGRDSGRRCCTGRMIHGSFERNAKYF
jgi:hypothetical protein